MKLRIVTRFGPLALVLLLCAAPARAGRPVVAVFNVQTKGQAVAQSTLVALTDFLAARLAESGRFRTVPRDQIKARLTQAKLESYKDCYDQSCQVELGRELAAEKSLAPRLLRANQRCVLTLELFDLKSATVEAAATAEGGCDIEALFKTVTLGVQRLVSKQRPASQPGAASPTPAVPKVSLFVNTSPAGAEVLLDGLYRGHTPVRIDVPRGKQMKLALLREGYTDVTRSITVNDIQRLELPLQLTAAGRMDLATTSEWFGIGVGSGLLGSHSVYGVSVGFRLFNIKWPRFFWTLMDFSAVIQSEDSSQDKAAAFSVSSRFGYPLYLGSRGQHQLLFGVGLGWMLADGDPVDDPTAIDGETRESASLFALSPGVDYIYNMFDGTIPLGAGVRVHLPVAGQMPDEHYPLMASLTLNIGFSLYRPMKGAVRRATAKSATQPAEPAQPAPPAQP